MPTPLSLLIHIDSVYLQGESWTVLFEENIPDVQGTCHAGGEVDRRSARTPATISQGSAVVSGPHNGRFFCIL